MYQLKIMGKGQNDFMSQVDIRNMMKRIKINLDENELSSLINALD